MVGYYSTSFLFKYGKNPPPISTIVNDKDANKDIYIIILDAFSSKEVLKKYFNCESRLLAYLGENGFQEHRSLSKYINTAQSLPNIFSGAVFDQKTAYKTKDIEQMQQLLPGRYLNNFAAKYEYQLKFSSFIIDKENNQLKKIFGRGSDFTIYFFSLTDRFMLYFFPSGKSSNNKGIHEIANQNIISIKKTLNQKAKNLSVHHFLTFHSAYFDKGFKESFIENLNEADEIGISIVQLILAQKPKAKIVILSDHAERGPEFDKKDSYKGILYIKN
ncbi:hypothetical protein [Pedobacter sp. ASV28]|uniref:hypothetical protein n=1 Tax=Pedobacter sp. ASV28 TaxID=2795123 RepID=UPI0018EBF21B|nr:hypothetical protein [Pedobacter sp. ASV28]